MHKESFDHLLSSEQKLLRKYVRNNFILLYDCDHNPESRIETNHSAEILVNNMLANTGISGCPDSMPQQTPETILRFAVDNALRNLLLNQRFGEFTTHNLRALEAMAESRFNNGHDKHYHELLRRLFKARNDDIIPSNHDSFAPWAYALRLTELTGDHSYADSMVKVLDQTLERRPKTPEGLMAGAGNIEYLLNVKNNESTVRCNTVVNEMLQFHAAVFCAAAKYTGNMSYLDEIMNLLRHIRDVHTDPADNLPCHYSRHGVRGGAKWGRGVCHVLWGLDLMLRFYPDMPKSCRDELAAFAASLGEAILPLQLENGLWRNVLDVDNSPPETSCTMGFAAVYARLINIGLLPRAKYVNMVNRAINGLLKYSWRGGIAENCFGTGISESAEYYIKRPQNFVFTGQLALALIEGDKLNRT